MLRARNEAWVVLRPLCNSGFLPTMNSQLMQLPLLVGSGRVSRWRALFSWRSPF